MKSKIQEILKGLAVGGAFMVPLAGLPLAIYIAKKLYGNDVSFSKVREVLGYLVRMGKPQDVSFKDWILYDENFNVL